MMSNMVEMSKFAVIFAHKVKFETCLTPWTHKLCVRPQSKIWNMFDPLNPQAVCTPTK
jgi:hypothetical protein